jgi:hypothetical protein
MSRISATLSPPSASRSLSVPPPMYSAGQVVHAVVGADVEHRHQVRVLQLGGDLALDQEAAGEVGVRRQDRRHHLQRDLAVERLLHRQEHAGHAALRRSGG